MLGRELSGTEAADALGKTRCDCIISDWNMAPVGGLELLQKVRSAQAPRTPADICFILLTGHADANVVNVAINLDVNAYLVKPVSYEKLIQSIDHAKLKNFGNLDPRFLDKKFDPKNGYSEAVLRGYRATVPTP